MKKLGKSWTLLAVFALVAIGCLVYVRHARAFTLIEHVAYLPAVQLESGQSALVHVSNTAMDPIKVTVEIVADDGKLLVLAVQDTISPGNTWTIPYTPASAVANSVVPVPDFRVVINWGDGRGIISDVQIQGSDGQLIGLLLPAVSPELLPAVQ